MERVVHFEASYLVFDVFSFSDVLELDDEATKEHYRKVLGDNDDHIEILVCVCVCVC